MIKYQNLYFIKKQIILIFVFCKTQISPICVFCIIHVILQLSTLMF